MSAILSGWSAAGYQNPAGGSSACLTARVAEGGSRAWSQTTEFDRFLTSTLIIDNMR